MMAVRGTMISATVRSLARATLAMMLSGAPLLPPVGSDAPCQGQHLLGHTRSSAVSLPERNADASSHEFEELAARMSSHITGKIVYD